jgi:hypothetical protein
VIACPLFTHERTNLLLPQRVKSRLRAWQKASAIANDQYVILQLALFLLSGERFTSRSRSFRPGMDETSCEIGTTVI